MSDQTHLDELAQAIVARMRGDVASFQGHAVRADAGEAGMIYVALRGAKRDRDAGEALAARISGLVEAALADEAQAVDFAVSLGQGDKDLLLQIELRAL